VVTGDAGIGDDPQHFIVSRQAPDWEPLIQILNKALASITPAERQEVSRRWLNSDSALKRLRRVQLSEQEQRWLQEHRSIRLGVDRAWPPMEFIDDKGKYSGIASDYVHWFGRQLGIHWVKPEPLPWSEVLARAKARNLDVLPLVARTPEREQYLLFTKPYFEARVVIVNRRGEPRIDSLEELTGRRMAVVEGYAMTSDLERDYPGIVLTRYDTAAAALHSVSEGRNEAFFGLLPVASYIIGREGLGNLQITADTEYTKRFSVGVRKDWPELVALLDKVIDTIDDETRNRILQRWSTVTLRQQRDYKLVLQVLAGASGYVR